MNHRYERGGATEPGGTAVDDILIHLRSRIILRLRFVTAVSPADAHPKADIRYFCYHLMHGERRLVPFLFSETRHFDRPRGLLLLEAYDESILAPGGTAADDVVRFLVALDFAGMKAARFSIMKGGCYGNLRVEGGTFRYDKRSAGLVQDTEARLDGLSCEPLPPLL